MTVVGDSKTAVMLLVGLLVCFSAEAALLSPSDSGFGGQTRSQNYDALLDAMYANGNTTTTIGDKLWVPWMSTSSGCTAASLHGGSSCNSGQTIDFTHNCMVTDEFSQVGVLASMGDDQTRMDQFFNTLPAIASTNGALPAWRVYRNGNTIEPCKSGINGNCDTASDASARIIIALYTASENPLFADTGKKAAYRAYAETLTDDFLQYEVDQTCRPSDLGYGPICYWLAAGSEAKRGGLGSTDYGYTGYYPDAIIAMLQACALTGDTTYCRVAGNFTLNYLQAAQWDGSSFSAPPGRSFEWVNIDTDPTASCTNTCSPVHWDSADAPRALGLCQANYYAEQIGYTLPGLETYCTQWGQRHMTSTSSAPIQYYPDGSAVSSQSGYFSQGLEALFQMGGHDPSLFEPTLDSALGHYSTTTQTWDWTACFGIYTQAFPMRALATGIGRDEASFPALSDQPADPPADPPADLPAEPPAEPEDIAFDTITPASGSTTTLTTGESAEFTYTLSNPSGLATSSSWSVDGTNQTGDFNSTTFSFDAVSAGTYVLALVIGSSQNTLSASWTIEVDDAAAAEAPAAGGAAGAGGAGGAPNVAGEAAFAGDSGRDEVKALLDPKEQMRLAVQSYFSTRDKDAVELVDELREYFAEVSG